MAILWCDSFNSYGTTSDMSKSYGSNSNTAVMTLSLTGGPSTDPCLATTASSNSLLSGTMYATPIGDTLGGRFWVKGGGIGATIALLEIGTQNSGGVTAGWSLGFLTGTGQVKISLGNSSGFTTSVGTTNCVDGTTFHLIEFQIKLHDSAGTMKVWVDGNLEINVAASDTFSGTVHPSQPWLTNFSFRSNTTTRFIDDFLLFDSSGGAGSLRTGDQPYGNLVIATLRPSGAGSSTQFTPSAGSNYQCVDEVAQNGATDYVASATSGHRDLYAMGDMGVVPTTVYGYVAKVFADNPGGGTISMIQTLKSGATISTSTATVANILGDYVVKCYDVDPNGSIAWTQTNVDAVEQGFDVV